MLKAAAGGQESGNGELSLVGGRFFTLSGAKGLLFHVQYQKQVLRFAQDKELTRPTPMLSLPRCSERSAA